MMESFHPENLKRGHVYKFKYRNSKGVMETETGKFVRMEADKDPRCLWLYFLTSSGRVPFDYSQEMKIEEVLV